MRTISLIIFSVLVIQISEAQSFNTNLATKLQAKLDSLVTAFSYNTKGVSASVYVPGQGIWKGVSGVSYTGEPLTSDMQLGIASNSKIFTAVTMLKLAENNIINLNDPLSKWIPAYTNVNPNITIRQLLNHTSGISDPFFTTGLLDTVQKYPTKVYTPVEILTWLGPKVYDPGVGYQYSNINYILAGMVAKSATGNDISKLIRDYILTPLHLDSTFCDIAEPVKGILAHRHHNMVDLHNISRISLNTSGGPAGFIFTTAGEMVKFYQALMENQVLSANSFAELTNFVSSGNYGLGIQKTTFYGRPTWGHSGSTIGYKSRIIYDPCMKTIVCCLANDDWSAMDGITLLLYKLLIDNIPTCAGNISGATTVCQGQSSVTYTVPEITNATSYNWSIPIGATGTSVTNSITLNYGISAVTSTVTVKGTNIYCDGAPSTLAIQVNAKPNTPTINQIGYVLKSDAPIGNQWYDGNGLISGATNQNYTVTSNGDYYVKTTLQGCQSDASNIINVVLSGINTMKKDNIVTIYPNPFKNELFINKEGKTEGTNFTIINTLGKIVYMGVIMEKTVIQTNNFKSGVYIIKIENGVTYEFIKIIKE